MLSDLMPSCRSMILILFVLLFRLPQFSVVNLLLYFLSLLILFSSNLVGTQDFGLCNAPSSSTIIIRRHFRQVMIVVVHSIM